MTHLEGRWLRTNCSTLRKLYREYDQALGEDCTWPTPEQQHSAIFATWLGARAVHHGFTALNRIVEKPYEVAVTFFRPEYAPHPELDLA